MLRNTYLAVMLAAAFLFSRGASGANVEPALRGAYTNSQQHPRVFMTPSDIRSLVARINTSGSFSRQNFTKLAGQIKADLATNVDWDAAYSGCDLDVYLHAFSYEPRSGYSNEVRTDEQLKTAMNVRSGTQSPAGAAIVASRLALYAVLAKNGAQLPPGSPFPDQAVALAKRILLAWAFHGFRDAQGNYLHAAEQFCNGQGQFNRLEQNGVGLQIGRGVIYSVHAQDLLQSLGTFNSAETNALNAFHSAMFNLLHESTNFRAALPEMHGPNQLCERYSNHVGAHMVGLLSIARLFDDGRKFNAVLYGNDRAIPMTISWIDWFNHAVYGQNDRPIGCHPNSGPDRLSSHPSFQTPIVAPGEIEDRYRNSTPAQGFGYPLGVLAWLYDMADLMENAGFDAYNYRGEHNQSIEMATQYYACYGRTAGFKNPVTADNARSCADYQQYIGQIVNGLEINIVMGTYHFPGNTAISALEAESKAKAGRDLLDPIHFGRWRN